jgi:hypothetical protein
VTAICCQLHPMKVLSRWFVVAVAFTLAPVDACAQGETDSKVNAKPAAPSEFKIEFFPLDREEEKLHPDIRIFKLTPLGAGGAADFESYWKLAAMMTREPKPAADSALAELKAMWARSYSHIWLVSKGEKKVAMVRTSRALPGDMLLVSLLDRDGQGPVEVAVWGWDAKKQSLHEVIATASKGPKPENNPRRKIREIRD